MEARPRVLILGGGEKFLRAAKTAGLEVLWIQKKAQFKEPLLAFTDLTLLLDFEDANTLLPIVRGLYEAQPFQTAIAGTEAALIPAAQVNEALGLFGNSLETARLLKDKWAMRCHLNRLGVSPVAAQVGGSEADMEAFLSRIGAPVIVKPVDGAGSLGIFLISDRSQISGVWQQLADLGLTSFIMEEYLDGPEVSVEAFSFHGHHMILAVTDKLTLPNFVEIGHTMPAQVDADLRREIVAVTHSVLTAVGLQEGPSHTELRLTRRGPLVVESHDRVGGDSIDELVKLVYGVDMVSMAFAWPFGLSEPIVSPPAAQAGAAIRFFTPQPGIVTAVTGVEAVKSHPAVYKLEITAKAGGTVREVRHSNDRSGFVIVRAENAAAAGAIADELAHRVLIQTEFR